MAKFRPVKGGGLAEVQQDEPEEVREQIIERFKPLVVADDAWEPFPEVDPGMRPTAAPWVLVQKRAPRKKIGSIHTSGETREVDGWRERVAKLLAVGPGCFRDIDGSPAFGETEGWPKVGEFVLIPSSGGTDFTRVAGNGERVTVTMFHWRDLMGVVTDVTL